MSDQINIKSQAAEMLLDVGVSIPLLRKFPFMRKHPEVVMHRPTIGNLMRIAVMFQKIGVTSSQLNEMDFDAQMRLVSEKGKEISRIVAFAVCPGYLTGRWFNRLVAWWLRWRVHPVILVQAMIQLLKGSGVKSFCNIIPLAEQVEDLLSPIGSQNIKMS